ncbi:MAG: glycosyltransferase family 39 protein [Anaerolineae bacterium]|nr:glycosyltransferase family 39 protein [Anaerolineae bacterium]
MIRRRRLWIPLLTVLLAYLLRTVTLDAQSFWMDEIQAFYFIDHPFMETVKMLISPEENGPLYFLLLWPWQRLTGPSDFAVRYLSNLCSVLTVAAMWQLVRTWFSRRVAGLTSVLLAISPYAIWYAQEAKMYALHMLLAALSTLLLVRAAVRTAPRHQGPRSAPKAWPLWLGYGVTLNLLGYSHFFGAFTIATQGIVLLITYLRRLRVIGTYALTMAIVALPYIPVVSFALRILPGFQMQDISKGFVPLRYIVQELASEYILRVSRLYVDHMPRLLLFGALVLVLGLYRAWRKDWRRGLWVTALFVMPTAIFYPISFYVPVFSPKYLSATFLMFVLILALALDQLRAWWRPLGWAGLAGVVVLSGWVNGRILANPTYQRSDWRATAAYLATHVKSDDAILGFADYIHRGINRYYSGPAPVYRFKGEAYNPEPFYRDLLETNHDHHTLWLVLHQDQAMAPHNLLQEVAGQLYPQITGVYPNNGQIAILGYSVRWRHTSLPAHATPADAAFDNGMVLVGYEVDGTELAPADDLLHPPSNWIHLTTFWRASEALTSDAFTPFVHLVGPEGGIWGGELQRPPTVFHRDPPTGWDAETIVEAHYDVNLNPATPPGTYRLVIGLVREDGAQITPSAGGTEFELAPVTITP